MGNRAVITTEENFQNNGIGVYVHWNGGRDSVTAFLKYCKMKGYRTPETDCYGWARLVQVIGNFFGGSVSVGIDTVNNLYCDNYDNGVYIIRNWEIVARKYFDAEEQNVYDLNEMLIFIDESMPKKEQLGKEFLTAPVVKPSEMKIGDVIAYVDWNGDIVKQKIIGFGTDMMVNGRNVNGIPYTGKFGSVYCNAEKNINNYLYDDEYSGREYRKIEV